LVEDLDFSDEGLGAMATAEAVAEEQPVVEEKPEPAEAESPEESEGDEATEPAEGEAAMAEETPAEEAARLFANKYKTADDLERAYTELQSKLGGKEQEFEQRMAAQLQAQQEQFIAYLEAQNQPQAAPDVEAVLSEVQRNPYGAFEYAAVNAPELVPQVLAAIAEEDLALANQMQLEYNQYLFDQKLAEAQAPLLQHQQQAVIERDAANAYNEFVKSNPDVSDIMDDWAQVMSEHEWMLSDRSVDGMKRFMAACADIAKGRALPRLAEAKFEQAQKRDAEKTAAFVESGTPGKAPNTESTDEASQIVADIFASQSGLYTQQMRG
jgi:hypothetical protein